MNSCLWMTLVAALYFGAAGELVAETTGVEKELASVASFRKPPREVTMIEDGFLWIDAEDFADYGEWRLDTQFVYLMGSPYLLAGGVGTPVKDATTEVRIPKAGRYRLWVRARNWLKSVGQALPDSMARHKLSSGGA